MQTQSTPDEASGSGFGGSRMSWRAVRRGLQWRLERARAVGIQMGPLLGAGIGLILWGACLILTGLWLLP